MHVRRRSALLALIATTATSSVVRAQQVDTTIRTDTLSSCEGLQVTGVSVRPRRPEFRGTLARWRRIARALGFHHATTRPGVVRRFVTLGPGHRCTEFRRAESERILRAQPYLASASVRALPDGRGGTIIDALTVDESSAIIGGFTRRGRIAGVTFGNENLLGMAMRVEAGVEEGFAYRDGFGGSFTHYQLFGRPYRLFYEGWRHPVGDEWVAEASHAFLTDLQRIAWHVGVVGRDDFLGLRRLDHDETALPVHLRRFDVGGVLRFGHPGRLGLIGGVLTGEHVRPSQRAVIVTDTGFAVPPPDSAALVYGPYDATRLNVVLGLRALRFRKARALDALTAEQDIARGMQIGVILGRAFNAFGSDGEDFMIGGDLFAGQGGPRSYLALRIEGEARLPVARSSWDGVVGSGRAAWYLKPASRLTFIASAEGAAGWNARLPVTLSLADRDGVRGVRGENAAIGSRRLVMRAEQRWAIGSLSRADVGLAGFFDAGRLIAGDTPYAESTGTVTAAGVSLLASVPRGGQRLYRVDFAVPLAVDEARLQIRLSITDPARSFWNEPNKVARVRSLSAAANVFSWP